jgi:hypothetical protein
MTNTLLIVGAGAGTDADLPTGADLKADIAKKLNIRFDPHGKRESGDPAIIEALYQHVGANPGSPAINPYVLAAQQIRVAMPLTLSIDSFIETRQGEEEIETCGKLAIVRSILEAESNSQMAMHPHPMSVLPPINFAKFEQTWFNKFGQLLTQGSQRDNIADRIGSMSIINFNYDRCIEHFLFHALQAIYGIPENEAADHINALAIIHPYGTVGYLPWQNGDNVVPFGDQKSGPDLLSRSTEIKTYTERVKDKATVDSMHKLVQDAENVVFLGFAFHPQNMELIKPDGPTEVKRVFATAKGKSHSDCEIVKERIGELFAKPVSKFRLDLNNNLTCSALFDEYSQSLAFS